MPCYEANWKDFNSPCSRNEIWTRAFYLYPKLFKLPRAVFGIASTKDAISYFADMESIHTIQLLLLDRIRKNPEEANRLVKLSDHWAVELNAFTARVQRADLKKMTSSRLIKIYDRFCQFQSRQYAVGVLLVLLDSSSGPNSIDNEVEKILSKHLQGKNVETALQIFTTPIRDSFAREQEKDLLVIFKKLAKDKSMLAAVTACAPGEFLQKLAKQSPSFLKMFKKHTQKWAWVYYVYAGPAWTETDFISIMKDWAGRGVTAEDLLAKWSVERIKIELERKEYLKKYNFSPVEKKILALPALVVWAKPRRKDYQSKSYWHMETFYREVTRRLYISLAQARSMTRDMLMAGLKNGKVNVEKIQSLFNFQVVAPRPKGPAVLTKKQALAFAKDITEEKTIITGTVFKGTPACPGKAIGKVVVINSTHDLVKMSAGAILVSIATSPSIIAAMRQASAIITDEGGLTCHAAIVSRELDIPCVIGLKFVTQAFKDGDMVEVDANRGIIRKI